MLIATFNASTGWAGKTVHHENDQFVLEGHGPISAADVLAYDEQGYLDWANDGTRAWVQAKVGPPQTRATTFSEAPVGPRLTSVWTKVKASAGAASVVAASAAQTAKVAYEGAIEAVKEQRGSASGPAGEETASPARSAEPWPGAFEQAGHATPPPSPIEPNPPSESFASGREDEAAEPSEGTEIPGLVATFGERSGWSGKTITYESGKFVLEGHGPITAQDVLSYDELGHLEWASDGTRAWVAACVSTTLGADDPPPESFSASADSPDAKALVVQRARYRRNPRDVFDAIVDSATGCGDMTVTESDCPGGTARFKVAMTATSAAGQIVVRVSKEATGYSVASFTAQPVRLLGIRLAPPLTAGHYRKVLERLVFLTDLKLAVRPPAGCDDDVIGVFRDETGSEGTRINRGDGYLAVEGLGNISPSDLLEHDDQGRVEWATDEMRGWVEHLATVNKAYVKQRENYFTIPDAVLNFYAEHEGGKDVDMVAVGFCGQCLILLTQSCVIVKPASPIGPPASYHEVPYADIESVIVDTYVGDPTVEMRSRDNVGANERAKAANASQSPACFVGSKKRWFEFSAAVYLLRLNSGVLEEEDPPVGFLCLVPECTVIGGHGLPLATGAAGDVLFADDELVFMNRRDGHLLARIPYKDVQSLEIGGPGVQQTGGGFIGGGFGLEGAAAGMMVATALNLLSTRTTIDTVICLRTADAEVYLHTRTLTPGALQMDLSGVFVRLRQLLAEQTTEANPSNIPPDAVEQLSKLAELHAKGALTDEEFATFKAKLMS